MQKTVSDILAGKTTIGIEFGSTRIKAVLIDLDGKVLAAGSFDWENQLKDGIWTYDLDTVFEGLRTSYGRLAGKVKEQYGVTLTTTGAIGISAMMHGYLAFDENDTLLVPFRTWRNTMTQEASEKLSEAFQFHIPQRWSIAHLYQAILNKEAHVKDIRFLTTLAGFVHWKLTGEKVLGIGDASGMFPIDSETKTYHADMLTRFDKLIEKEALERSVSEILPRVLCAGEEAGRLSAEGAALLDESGSLQPGIPFCPPEGDAGTGMTATNSVAKRTGNVSAGTSVFAMVVLEKPLSAQYEQLDLVTTPEGSPVAMVHCNNCTSDLNAWVSLFEQCLNRFGLCPDKSELYGTLYAEALKADKDLGGMLAYNYFSGEHITGFEEGRPLFVRMPDSRMSLANFMCTHLYTCLGALKTGMDILIEKEHAAIDKMTGHGGFFKTREVTQGMMAAAVNAPVAVMETAGEGGAWGIALLAAYLISKREKEDLAAYLAERIFAGQQEFVTAPKQEDMESFALFMQKYNAGLTVERAAIEALREDM